MYKFGQVAIVGRANVGKSTLINKLMGEKISIVSPKAQTTRNNINGILTLENAQIVFVDTPGILKAKDKLSDYMMRGIKAMLEEVDILLYLIDGEKGVTERDLSLLNTYKDKKIITCITKFDIADKARLIKEVEKLGELSFVLAIIPIASYKGTNINVLIEEIIKHLPEGQKMYDEDYLTDKSTAFLVTEFIREKLLYNYQQEIPHGVSVSINLFEFDDVKKLYTIDADIVCEKASHKGIIIGKQGESLKKTATAARYEIEKMLDAKVFLTLWVRVKENWRDSESLLKQLGYDSRDFNA